MMNEQKLRRRIHRCIKFLDENSKGEDSIIEISKKYGLDCCGECWGYFLDEDLDSCPEYEDGPFCFSCIDKFKNKTPNEMQDL